MEKRNVNLSPRELALILRGVTNSNAREFWLFVFVPPGQFDLMESMQKAFYSDATALEWSEVLIPCDQTFETVRGTRREVRDFHAVLALRERLPAQTIIEAILMQTETGMAQGSAINDKMDMKPFMPTPEQLETMPIIWMLDGREWSDSAMIAMRTQFRRWIQCTSGFPFPVPDNQLPAFQTAVDEAMQAMVRAVKRAMRPGEE